MSGRRRLPESEKRKRLVLYVTDIEREALNRYLCDYRERMGIALRGLPSLRVYEDWEANRVCVESEGGRDDAASEE